jgi:hypothetical protein
METKEREILYFYILLYELNERLFKRKRPGIEFSESNHPIAQEVKKR